MITKILNKYKAQRDYYYPNSPKADYGDVSKLRELENKLQNKWKNHIPPRWYGFALAPCPESWLHIVDEFLDYLLALDPDFKVLQVKCKFGGIRMYLNLKIEDEETLEFVNLQIKELEFVLYDKKLIY